MDIAASIQAVTEEAMLRAARHVHAETGMHNLCLASGVALNCVGNGRVLREGTVRQCLDPAGRGEMQEELWGWRCSSGTNSWTSRGSRGRRMASTARCSARRRRTTASGPSSLVPARSMRSTPTMPRCAMRWPTCWRASRWWTGSRGVWSSARARSAREASSATPAAATCSP